MSQSAERMRAAGRMRAGTASGQNRAAKSSMTLATHQDGQRCVSMTEPRRSVNEAECLGEVFR